jgi:predicted  nucleic acid-binding Zn-ribbon protein
MSNEVKKGELFIKEVIARLKCDEPEAKAAKIARKALSAVESQLAALRARKVDLENNLEDAKEALKNAKYPTEVFVSNQDYIKTIQSAQKACDNSQEELDAVNESITYFEELLASF